MMNFAEYAAFLRQSAATCRPLLQALVRETAIEGAEYAKDLIGHPHDDWEPLALSTMVEKHRLGFRPPDYEPLLRSGEMRDSIVGVADGLTGVVGSPSKILLYQELGTARIPPRPVTSKAVHEFAMPAIEVGCQALAVELLVPRGNRE